MTEVSFLCNGLVSTFSSTLAIHVKVLTKDGIELKFPIKFGVLCVLHIGFKF